MTNQRVCVFVDGENLRHSIIDLFPGEFSPSDYLPKQARWGEFYRHLADSAKPNSELLRTYWYVVQYVDFFPYNLRKYDGDKEQGRKLVEILGKHRPYAEKLAGVKNEDAKLREADNIRGRVLRSEADFKKRFEGWQKIQDRICDKHRSVEFRRAGAIHFNTFTGKLGTEKAVDVKLATDLILLRDIYDVAVIVSGDQDYVPAVQAIKDKGKRVVNVAFLKRGGSMLPGGARRLNQVTDGRIAVPHEDCKKFLAI